MEDSDEILFCKKADKHSVPHRPIPTVTGYRPMVTKIQDIPAASEQLLQRISRFQSLVARVAM